MEEQNGCNVGGSSSECADMSSDALEIIQDDEFYYPDGSIVVIAGQTAFRLHCGILARESDVFRDMLSMPLPEAVEQYDDCPVVHISDSVSSLRYLLRFLLTRRYFTGSPNEPLDFSAIAALIRLGNKYEIDSARAYGVKLLKENFSDDFETFTAVLRTHQRVQELRQMAIPAVNLARLTGAISVLPAALYTCTLLPGAELVQGISFPDGSREQLTAEDLAYCIDARKRLMIEDAAAVNAIFVVRASCASPDVCKALMAVALQTMHAGAIDGTPLNGWTYWISRFPFCVQCTAGMSANARRLQRDNWDRLPLYFGLEIENWGRESGHD